MLDSADATSLFGTYSQDQTELREELLAVCRGGLSEKHVNTMHAPGCVLEWRGLPDLHGCPLPPDLAIETSRLEALLRAGAFPDCSDAYGRTPVFFACLLRDAEALHLLLRAGASAQR